MPRNMGLGALKGALNGKTRKSRIDAAIEEDSGPAPKKAPPKAKTKTLPKKKK